MDIGNCNIHPNLTFSLHRLRSTWSTLRSTIHELAQEKPICFSAQAFVVQQLTEIADGDNRGLALLLPLIPAIIWVLYNILQTDTKSDQQDEVIIEIGLGGVAASCFFHMLEASAAVADNRGPLLLFVVTPSIAWVLYNILQHAFNQINRISICFYSWKL
ncbi:hypothetical protein ACS0TY_026836 [Phlomoides rotata]